MEYEWFAAKPLFGKRVVVTRAADQARPLVDALREQGAETIEVPVIEIADAADGGAALRDAASRVGEYDWLVLTSTNGASRFLGALRDARELGGVKVAAIGPATADAIRAYNVEPDLVPTRFVAETLVEEFPEPGEVGGRVLVAGAATAREVLPTGLADKGWKVDVVEAYRTHTVELSDEQRDLVAGADIVTFTSSSTVTSFLRAMRSREAIPPVVACIGPITEATARDHEIHVDVVADVHTIEGLVAALVGFLTRAVP
jgi:uroporphyrinogen III methyltransferase/synthase